jgi:hypothetical protein
MKRSPVSDKCLLAAFVAMIVVFHADTRVTARDQGAATSFTAGGVRSFGIVPLETVSETSSNASIGDLNGDGDADIVLVKGRHSHHRASGHTALLSNDTANQPLLKKREALAYPSALDRVPLTRFSLIPDDGRGVRDVLPRRRHDRSAATLRR